MNSEKPQESIYWYHNYLLIKNIIELSKKSIKQSQIFQVCQEYFLEQGILIGSSTLSNWYKDVDPEVEKDVRRSKISQLEAISMYDYLQKTYHSILNNTSSFDDFQDFFIYYYQSGLDYVKPAILCFNIINEEWSNGVLLYLKHDKSYFERNSTFHLERISPHAGLITKPEFLYFKATSPDFPNQVNMFTFNVSHKPIERRYLFFIASLAITSKDKQFPSVNFGIVRRVSKSNIWHEVNSIIDPWISNSLQKRRMTFGNLESSVFATVNKFIHDKNSDEYSAKNKQFTRSKEVNGYYSGYYLRNEISDDTNDSTSGVACLLLEIKEDGNAYIYFYRTPNSELINLKGYLKFPHDSSKSIIGFFGLREQQDISRIAIFLNGKNAPNKLGGFISGFRSDLINPFSSPIIFYRIFDHFDDVKSITKKYYPGRISKNKLSEYFNKYFGELSQEKYNSVKSDLIKINNTNIDSIENFFPK